MTMDKLNTWLTLIANIGVLAGIVFLAIEIRTNTETNRIGIQESFSGNWIEINPLLAGNVDAVTVFEKGLAGEVLSNVEERQFVSIVGLYATQANL